MLEIKGVKGPVARTHLSQLQQWMTTAAAEGVWEGKGLLIVNTFRQSDPATRERTVPDDCSKLVKIYGHCIVTTTQLFRALHELQSGTLDAPRFWDAVMTETGLCSLPELGDS